jgi:hypothetical protein
MIAAEPIRSDVVAILVFAFVFMLIDWLRDR